LRPERIRPSYQNKKKEREYPEESIPVEIAVSNAPPQGTVSQDEAADYQEQCDGSVTFDNGRQEKAPGVYPIRALPGSMQNDSGIKQMPTVIENNQQRGESAQMVDRRQVLTIWAFHAKKELWIRRCRQRRSGGNISPETCK
jgi:hypothetical protein